MISQQRFTEISGLIAARLPDKQAEFATYEKRLLDDVKQWLDKYLPKPNGWSRDDLLWAASAEPVADTPPTPTTEDRLSAIEKRLATLEGTKA